MQLDQFDKLQRLVSLTSEQIYRLKFENRNLLKENESLKQQIQEIRPVSFSELSAKISELEDENKRLKEKHQTVSSRLTVVLDKLKQLS